MTAATQNWQKNLIWSNNDEKGKRVASSDPFKDMQLLIVLYLTGELANNEQSLCG